MRAKRKFFAIVSALWIVSTLLALITDTVSAQDPYLAPGSPTPIEPYPAPDPYPYPPPNPNQNPYPIPEVTSTPELPVVEITATPEPTQKLKQGACVPSLISPGGVPDEGWGFDESYKGRFGLNSKHNAQDFKSPEGYIPFTVVASASGKIIRLETDNIGSGGVIEIEVAECPGWVIQYVHMRGSTIDHLKVGQSVTQGQGLGIADGSGTLSGGPHLHFKVFQPGRVPNDPIRIINFDGSVVTHPLPPEFGNLPGTVTVGVGILILLIVALVLSPRRTIAATWWTVSTIVKVPWTLVKGTGKSAMFVIRSGWKMFYYMDSYLHGVTHPERARNRRIGLSSCITVFLFTCCIGSVAVFVTVSERVTAERVITYILSRTERLEPLVTVIETTKKIREEIDRLPRVSLVPDEWTIPLINKKIMIKVPTEWHKKTVYTPLPPLGAVAVEAKISHYWPPLGGPNCANFVNGKCLSKMASNLPWQDYVDRAVACPKEYPFWTKVYAFGQEWVCLDRGGKIVREGDLVWLDFLTSKAPENTPYGAIRTVYIVLPPREEGR